MELRHLRYFTAVAEHLNYSETSRRIHVAQPPISQTIIDLEEELGVRLLLRDRRTVRPTAAGETFRREALEILRRNQEAVRLTKRASLGEIGQLRIGFFGAAMAAFLPGLVQEYHRHFPDVESDADHVSTVLLLVESGIGVSIVSGSVRHLLRAGGLVVFCRLQPASAPVELRMSWRRAAPSSPTVEAFREVVQSQREAIRAVMEARPSEKKQR